jgi:hypothetical protein
VLVSVLVAVLVAVLPGVQHEKIVTQSTYIGKRLTMLHRKRAVGYTHRDCAENNDSNSHRDLVTPH